MLKTIWLSLVAIAISAPARAGQSGITYHARIIKPDETALEGREVQFRLQIRSPGTENCLLYEELQTHDLRNTGGVIAITINDGTGTRLDGGSYNIDQIFANRTSFTLPSAKCETGTGTTVWTPNSSDGRRFQVMFRENSTRTWEPLPATQLNFVPMAIESKQVGGFAAMNLLRVADASGPAVAPMLSPAQATELVALTNGSSNAYTKAGQLNGFALPTSIGNNESIRWNGTGWEAFTPSAMGAESDPTVQAFAKAALPTCSAGQVLFTNGTTLSCVTDASGSSVVDATTSVKGVVAIDATGGISVSGGTIRLSASGVSAGTYTKVTVDATGRVTSGGSLAAGDVPSLDAAKITSGTLTNPLVTTGAVSANSVSGRSIYVWDSDSTNSVQIVTPATGALTSNYILTLPADDGTNGQLLQTDGSGNLSWVAAGGSGTVTNVGLSLPSIFSVTGGPITTNGTFNATLASQSQNTVFAAPSGSNGTPSFRAMVEADVPALSAGKITSGTFAAAQIPALDASKITTGTFAQAQIPALGAAQIPNLDAAKITSGTFAGAQIPALDAAKITTGTITLPVNNTSYVGTRLVDVWDSDNTQKVTLQAPATATLTTSYVLTLPSDDGINGQLLQTDGSGNLSWVAAGGSGTVTNVGLTLPSIFSVTGGPITTNGTFSATLASQTQNTFFAAPNGSNGAPSFRTMVEADVPALSAGKITSGTFAAAQIPALGAAQIPNLDAAKITSGTFAPALIPDLDAAKITSGIFAVARIPALDASNVATGTFAASQIPALDASKITTGTFAQAQIPALGAAQIPNLDAAKITTGTLAVAQIPALDAAKITTGTITLPVNNTSYVGTRLVDVWDSDSTQRVSLQAPATASLTTSYVLTLPSDDGINGQLLQTDGSGNLSWVAAGGSGTVTNVGLTLPSIFSVSGGPITTNGTFSATLASQTQNTVFAAPSGSNGTPSFRAMLEADVPALSAGKITSGTFAAAQIPALDAAKITTGTFAQAQIPALGAAQIPNLDAAKITSGTFAPALIPDLDAAKITSGTFALARIPALDASNVATGTFAVAQIPSLDASKVTTGTFAQAQIPALGAAQIPNLDAAKITTGTLTIPLVTTGAVSANSVSGRSIYVWDSDSTNSVQIVTPATGALTSNYILTLPADDGTNGQLLQTDGSGNLSWVAAGGSGTVTNVGLSLPSIFSVSGGPITTNGTFSATLASQMQNTFFAAPNGSNGTPTFRTMVEADVPALSAGKITSGTFAAAQIPALDAAKITTGTFAQAQIPALGTAQIPNLDAAKITSGTFAVAQIPALDAAKITTGTITLPVNNTSSVGTRAVDVWDSDNTQKVTLQAPATATLTTSYVLTLPSDDGINGQLLQTDGSGNLSWVAAGGSGTVTNVGLTLPSIFSVTGGPITTNGTFSATLASQTQNTFFAAPNGSNGAPSFRTMVEADVPALSAGKITSGTFAAAQIPALDASKITTGTFAQAQIPALSAAQIPNLDAAKITTGTLNLPLDNTSLVGTRTIRVYDSDSTNNVSIVTPATGTLTSNYVLTLPADDGAANQVLQTDGSGGLSWITPATTTSGTFRADNGTATVPTFSFTGDTNTGMYNVAADTLGFSTQGSNRLTIDPTGNVGIGITTPSYPLHVVKSGFAQMRFESSNDSTELDMMAYGAGKQSLLFLSAARGTRAAPTYLQSGDSIGYIGASAAQGGSQAARLMFFATAAWSGTSTPGNMVFSTTPANSTVPVDRMELDAQGVLRIGSTASTTPLLDVNAPIRLSPQGTSANQGGELRFQELAAQGTNFAAIRAPDALGASYVLTLPTNDGNANDVLQTNGSGGLSWVAPSAGGVTFPLLADDGTSAAPAYSFANQNGTGMYYDGANSALKLTLGGDEALAIQPGAVSVMATDVSAGFTVGNLDSTAARNPHIAIMNFRGAANDGHPRLNFVNMEGDLGGGGQFPLSGVTLGEINFGLALSPEETFGAGLRAYTTENWTNSTDAGSQLKFYTTANDTVTPVDQMTITHDGKVGIGTSSPTTKLHVNGAIKLGTGTCGATTQGSLQFDGTNIQFCNTSNTWTTLSSGSSGDVVRGGNTQASGTMVVGTNDAFPLALETNGTSRMTILNTGEVGVGTASPSFALDVQGTAVPIRAIATRTTNAAVTAMNLDVQNSAGAGGTGLATAITFRGETTTSTGQDMSEIGSVWTDGTHASRSAALTFGTSNNAGAVTERMRVASGGNVGIGTTNPTALLHVNGSVKLGTGTCGANTQGSLQFDGTNIQFCNTSNAWTTLSSVGSGDVVRGGNTQSSGTMVIGTNDAFPLALETNGTNRMVVDNVGNVAFGSATTNSSFALKISRGTTGNAGITMSNPTATAGFDIGLDPNSLDSYVWNGNVGGWLQFGTNSAARMTIAAAGNVGIGTTNPQAHLHVNGIVRIGSGTCGANTQGSLQFDGTNIQFCNTSNAWTTLSSVGSGDVVRGGNTQSSGTMVIGTNDAYPLALETNGVSRLNITSSGDVGIGTTSPRAGLDVQSGSIIGKASTSNGALAIDFANGNIQHTTASCGAVTLNNLKDGGTYMFIVKGTTVATCSFTAYSGSGTTGPLTVHLPPDHGATTTGKHTIYNIAVSGGDVYFAWTPGY